MSVLPSAAYCRTHCCAPSAQGFSTWLSPSCHWGFVIDILNEEIAVNEAKRLNIPCVGLVDTNSDPTQVAFPIPGNDDAVKSVRLIVSVVSDAIQAGLARREAESAARRAAAPVAKQEIAAASVEPEVTISPDLLKDSQLADAKKPVRRTGTRKPRAPKAKAE